MVQCDANGANCVADNGAQGDISAITINAGATTVTVTTTFRGLTSFDDGMQGEAVRIQTKAGVNRTVRLVRSGGQLLFDLVDASGGALTCAGMSQSIDFGAKTMQVSVPTSCLDNTTQLSVGIASVWSNDPEGSVVHVDDAYANRTTSLPATPSLSHKINVG